MVSETFKRISIQELHPTFGAEVDGLDLSKPVEEDVFQEILEAITKVNIFPKQKMTDANFSIIVRRVCVP